MIAWIGPCWWREVEIRDPKVFNRSSSLRFRECGFWPILAKIPEWPPKRPFSTQSVSWLICKMERWKQCSLRVQAFLRCNWADLCFVISHAHLELGQGLREGVANSLPKPVRKAVNCTLFPGCTKIQGWHSRKPRNNLKWKLKRGKKVEVFEGWTQLLGRKKKELWFHSWVGAVYNNLKQALRLITAQI